MRVDLKDSANCIGINIIFIGIFPSADHDVGPRQ